MHFAAQGIAQTFELRDILATSAWTLPRAFLYPHCNTLEVWHG